MARNQLSPFAPIVDRGRPRAIVLTPEQGQRLAEIYLATNRTRKEGSQEAAWVLFCESEGVFLHTVMHHRLVGSLPTEAQEWMRRAKGLVVTHRGGSKELRLKGPYQQGGMRSHWEENRRLRAGESYSVDDLTRNVACWIPWPHGGCPCSEEFGVRLGRWQTLVVCDDATWSIPAYQSVFRYSDSYQGGDAASLIYQTERNVGMAGFAEGESRWVVEGGVWQSKHALAALDGRFYSAKGRPMQKLIERWFNAAQTLDAVWNRDLGRQRGEKLENNKLWLACRKGEADPRKHFPNFNEGQASFMHLIHYMNEREVRSKDLYGCWVPQERWDCDVQDRPLICRPTECDWVMMPERREVKVVRSGELRCTVIMADGVSRKLAWNAPWLYQWLGRKLELYFDPLGAWPLTGTCVVPGTRRVAGEVVCQNPFGESRDADRERVAAIRRTMLSDLNIILGGNAGARRVVGRGIGGTIEIRTQTQDPKTQDRREETFGAAASREGLVGESHTRGRRAELPAPAPAPLAPPVRGGVAAEPLRSLSRRAAAARELEPNW